jgi:16S rRNA (adenine1518-N6/adenine1519-N6)-dimethyltransferase
MNDRALLPPLRDVIAQFGLRAEKKLGQNFLLDQNITDKIVRAAGDLSGVHVLEIGPGPGGLTRSLLASQAVSVTAIEFDPRAVEALGSLQTVYQDRFQLIKADAIHSDERSLVAMPRAIIANLPYNISTVLLLKWLRHLAHDPTTYAKLILMFQKEVAERLMAPPSTTHYGRLSVMAQWLCDIQPVFDLPPSAFTPPPKVTSTIVSFLPKAKQENAPAFEKMEFIVGLAFQQRRKMLRSSLKNYVAQLEACDIDPTLRAENVTVAKWCDLANKIS